jgi:hypothetical protein
MNLRVARWSGVFAVGASVVLAAPALRAEDRAKASAAVDLSGRWRLDKKLSDDEGATRGKGAVPRGAEAAGVAARLPGAVGPAPGRASTTTTPGA